MEVKIQGFTYIITNYNVDKLLINCD